MNRLGIMLAAVTMAAAGLAPVAARAADKQPRDHVRYEKNHKDPALEAMGDAADSLKAFNDSITGAIQKERRAQDKSQADAKPRLRFDWSRVVKPASPEAFKPPFHFPPHRQYRTGTCWCFSTTSFFETEMQRLHGKSVKLSEMHTVYLGVRGEGARLHRQARLPALLDRLRVRCGDPRLEAVRGGAGHRVHGSAAGRRQVRRRAAVRRDGQLPRVGKEQQLLGRGRPHQPDPRHPRPHPGAAARGVRVRGRTATRRSASSPRWCSSARRLRAGHVDACRCPF